jgi:hypothetical protein
MVRSAEFWCAHPLTFNDPFDSQIPVRVTSDPELIAMDEDHDEEFEYFHEYMFRHHGDDPRSWPAISRTPELLRQAREEHDEMTGTTRESRINRVVNYGHDGLDFGHGVLSLSEDPLNILMWSHYAENHTGLVIRINTSLLDEAHQMNLLRVRYTVRYPKPRMTSRYSEYVPVEKLFGYKAKLWSYEKEWRYISDKVGTVRFTRAAVDGIVFGCRCPVEIKNHICDIIEARGRGPEDVTLMSAKMVDGRFGLSLDVDMTL